MGKMDELATLLERKAQETKDNEINWEKEKEKWLKDLDIFFENVKFWLKPLGNHINITDTEISLSEDHIGTYNVKSLIIKVLDQTIRIIPKGTLIVGAKGRVDFTSNKGTVIVVKPESEWKIATKNNRGYDYIDFNEETLAEIIQNLI